ncbi:MAG: acyltransferase domain-containing protein, partial [Planctomycetota bacterium]
AAMLAVAAWAQAVEEASDALGLDVRIANVNAPRQTIVAGPREAIQEAAKRLPERGLAARRVAVSAAFHTPAVREASESLVHDLDRIRMRPPDLPVYSNVTAAPYPGSVAGVKGILSRHLAHPVRFVDEIRAMHQGGLRVFLEVGPGRILTGLVRRILEGEDYGAIALDQAGKPAWLSLGHLLSHVFALGLDVDLGPWFRHRGLEDRDVAAWRTGILTEAKGRPTDWWLEPGGFRPVGGGTPAPVVPPAEGTTVTHAVEAPPMTSASDDPALPPPDADLARRVHETTAAWLALQREQLRLNERFLRLQERLLGGGLPDEEAPRALPRMPALTPGEALAPGEASPLVEALPTLAGPAGFSVPPAPVLPPLEPEGAGAVPDPDPGAGAG